MASLNSVELTALEIFALKVHKTEHFLMKIPHMKFQKLRTKSLISEFSKLFFK